MTDNPLFKYRGKTYNLTTKKNATNTVPLIGRKALRNPGQRTTAGRDITHRPGVHTFTGETGWRTTYARRGFIKSHGYNKDFSFITDQEMINNIQILMWDDEQGEYTYFRKWYTWAKRFRLQENRKKWFTIDALYQAQSRYNLKLTRAKFSVIYVYAYYSQNLEPSDFKANMLSIIQSHPPGIWSRQWTYQDLFNPNYFKAGQLEALQWMTEKSSTSSGDYFRLVGIYLEVV